MHGWLGADAAQAAAPLASARAELGRVGDQPESASVSPAQRSSVGIRWRVMRRAPCATVGRARSTPPTGARACRVGGIDAHDVRALGGEALPRPERQAGVMVVLSGQLSAGGIAVCSVSMPRCTCEACWRRSAIAEIERSWRRSRPPVGPSAFAAADHLFGLLDEVLAVQVVQHLGERVVQVVIAK